MGADEFIIPLNNSQQIIFKLDDIKKMDQNYKPGNIFFRFVFRPITANSIANMIPTGA